VGRYPFGVELFHLLLHAGLSRRFREIEVLFVEDGPEQTRVEVEHRYFERIDGGQAIHDAIRGGGSWTVLLESYAKTAANAR
jgi:hypothetical protein